MTYVIAIVLMCIGHWSENWFTMAAAGIFALIAIGEAIEKKR